MNKCSYQREDQIRNIVSRVLKYTFLTVFWSAVVAVTAVFVIAAPVQTFSILAFTIGTIMLMYLWLWCAGLVNICARPPEDDGPFYWRDFTTGIKHQWIKDDALAEGGLWVPVAEESRKDVTLK